MRLWTLFFLLAVFLTAADFAPKAFRLYSMTKSQKYSVKGKTVVTVSPSKATSVYLNGKGDDWAIAAGAIQDIYVFRNVSSLTFKCTSTAAADPNKIRIMEP